MTCGGDTDLIQPTVTSGNTYVVPGTGTITSWSNNAGGGANQTFTLKVFRKVADPTFYMVVAHAGPLPLLGNRLNTFPASIPVKPGDVIGANTSSTTAVCLFAAPGGHLPVPRSACPTVRRRASTPIPTSA